jgi:branched-chain amino acid transport system ATP-binding protein
MSAPGSLLVASGVTKLFGGVVALDHVDLEIGRGEVVGIVGPNGAGKTTLFNCLFGLEVPDAGTVSFDGRRIDRMAVWKRSRLGIGRTFQRMELFEGMTVADHLLVAEQAASGTVRIWRDLLRWSSTTSRRCSTSWGSATSPAGRSTHSTWATPDWWNSAGR